MKLLSTLPLVAFWEETRGSVKSTVAIALLVDDTVTAWNKYEKNQIINEDSMKSQKWWVLIAMNEKAKFAFLHKQRKSKSKRWFLTVL